MEDYRFGVLASIVTAVAGKATAPSVWFPSLAGVSAGSVKPLEALRREDLPAEWKVTTGKDAHAWAARLAAEKMTFKR